MSETLQLPYDIVYTVVFLSGRQFARLQSWVGRPTEHTVHGDNGGMQKRRRDWRERMNAEQRSIRLTTPSSAVRATEDDITWIRKTIANRHGGGYQSHIAFIFEDTHPAFTGVAILPRRRPNR